MVAGYRVTGRVTLPADHTGCHEETMVHKNDPVALVRAWQEAANRQESDRLVELSTPDIEIVGPRGSARGHQVLRDWLGRAGLTLTTRRVFARGTAVVIAQHGVWRSAETGDVIGESDLATAFQVDGQHIARVGRFDDLAAALTAAGLGEADEIAQP
jgi:hypothetical protein